MRTTDSIVVARQLQDMGVDIVRGGFATWVREDLGFEANDESIDRALTRVQGMVADDGITANDLEYQIAAAMPAHPSTHIDAFGGSTWTTE